MSRQDITGQRQGKNKVGGRPHPTAWIYLHASFRLSVCLYMCLSACLPVCLSIYIQGRYFWVIHNTWWGPHPVQNPRLSLSRSRLCLCLFISHVLWFFDSSHQMWLTRLIWLLPHKKRQPFLSYGTAFHQRWHCPHSPSVWDKTVSTSPCVFYLCLRRCFASLSFVFAFCFLPFVFCLAPILLAGVNEFSYSILHDDLKKNRSIYGKNA